MNYCQECNKSYSTIYNLKRHQKTIHDNRSEESDNADKSSTGSENIDTVEDEKSSQKSNSTTSSSSAFNSILTTDEDAFRYDADDKVLNLDDNERYVWKRLIKSIDPEKIHGEVKVVSDLWKDENNLKDVKDQLSNVLWKIQHYIATLNEGEIYPQIKEEIKALQRNGYYKHESWKKAWDNRIHLIKMLLKENENTLKEKFFPKSSGSKSATQSTHGDESQKHRDESTQAPVIPYWQRMNGMIG